jgi:hypothetical protein
MPTPLPAERTAAMVAGKADGSLSVLNELAGFVSDLVVG